MCRELTRSEVRLALIIGHALDTLGFATPYQFAMLRIRRAFVTTLKNFDREFLPATRKPLHDSCR